MTVFPARLSRFRFTLNLAQPFLPTVHSDMAALNQEEVLHHDRTQLNQQHYQLRSLYSLERRFF